MHLRVRAAWPCAVGTAKQATQQIRRNCPTASKRASQASSAGGRRLVGLPWGQRIRGTSSRVRSVAGTGPNPPPWVNKLNSPDNKNLGKVNELTAQGMRHQDAVYQAWTSKLAAEFGFNPEKSVYAQGSVGMYTKIEVLITR